MIEKLESRRLFAAPTVTFASGLLTIKGGSQSDIITVVEQSPASNPSNVHVEVSTPYRNYFFTQDYTGVKNITITAGSKPDTIYHTGNRINPKIYGGSGNDSLTVFDVGTGSSYIDAGSGDDSITLDIGTVNPPGTSSTTVHGGDGNDTIYVNTDTSGAYDVANARSQVFGDKGNDTVLVYAGVNTITGDSGYDTYFVYGGTNTITDSGGTNNYQIGDPTLGASGGTNNITGGGGVDNFTSYGGVNTLKGGSGNDLFNTYAGSTNNIDGGGGTDTLYRHNSGGAVDTYTSIEKLFVVV